MPGIRARQKAERPREILEAGFHEFVRNGFTATRLEDIAQRVGVTKGTIYFYFESKEKLFEAVLNEGSRQHCEALVADIAWTNDLVGDLRTIIGRLYAKAAENTPLQETLRLLIAEAKRFPALVDQQYQDYFKPVLDQVAERLIRAMELGEARRLPLAELTDLTLAPILAADILKLLFDDRRPLDYEKLVDTHVALLTEGLLAKGGAGFAAEEPSAEATPANWTAWRPFPDPRLGGSLTAPLGAGLFEVRLRGGEPLLIEAARSVASRLTLLIPVEIRTAQRQSSSRRRFLVQNLPDLQYRTLACASFEEARAILQASDPKPYRFTGAA